MTWSVDSRYKCTEYSYVRTTFTISGVCSSTVCFSTSKRQTEKILKILSGGWQGQQATRDKCTAKQVNEQRPDGVASRRFILPTPTTTHTGSRIGRNNLNKQKQVAEAIDTLYGRNECG